MNKLDMKKLVDNAPEGATHVTLENISDYQAYFKCDFSKIFVANYGTGWEDTQQSVCIDDAIELDYSVVSYKPVYTQAMADNGEFPPVGVRCEFECYLNSDTDWMGCYVIGDTEDGKCIVIHDDEDNLHFAFKVDGSIKFRPSKTDKEKLIDEFYYHITQNTGMRLGDAKKLAIILANSINITRKDTNNDL